MNVNSTETIVCEKLYSSHFKTFESTNSRCSSTVPSNFTKKRLHTGLPLYTYTLSCKNWICTGLGTKWATHL